MKKAIWQSRRGTARKAVLRAAMAVCALAATFGTPHLAEAATTELSATYFISIAGLTVGRAKVEGRFTETQYAAAISGSTFGVSRFVSDAEATLSGNGRFQGDTVVPNSYNLDTSEGGLATAVRMSMAEGNVTTVEAYPELIEAPDRVAVLDMHRRGIVDPIGAFIVSNGSQGPQPRDAACQRTVRVFDGWQRFDVQLFFKHIKRVSGAYNGNAVVCGARYTAIAGHRPARPSVAYMSDNKRLEVWLVPVQGTSLMIPYQVVIGTAVGDLLIGARRFDVSRTGTTSSR